ncbi:MAG: integration host factor subunit alpha [Beijerinckiaceae bacterium]
MEKRTVTRVDLLEAVSAISPGLSRNEARELFELTLDEIAAALVRGDKVNLRSFGSFTVRSKSQRIGRNPRTGVAATITPRRVLTFKASPRLVRMVNGEV